jgi:hypothetical protein
VWTQGSFQNQEPEKSVCDYQQKSQALNATEHVSCINEMTQKWTIKVTKSVTETNVPVQFSVFQRMKIQARFRFFANYVMKPTSCLKNLKNP